MQRNITKKSLAILVVLMLVFTFVVSACDNGGKFVNPSMPEAGTVSGNGGLVVTYGDYLYYVNGAVADSTQQNGYTGAVKNGDIVRIKTDDLKAVLALNDDEQIASSDLAKEISKKVFESAEVVVPYFYYTGNTTTKSVNGLYIFNERLYFITPNADLATDGSVKNSELCVYSSKLDGTDLTKLHTVASTTAVVMLNQVETSVYATYVLNGSLYSVKLGEKEVEIAKEITSEKYTSNAVFFLDKDGAICTYAAGAAESKVLVAKDEDKKMTYTINSANGDYVYFTQKDSSNTQLYKGIYAIKDGMTEATEILTTVPPDSYLCYGEKVIIAGVIETIGNITPIELYMTSGQVTNKEFIIDQNTNNKTISLVKLDNDVLYYTRDGKTYCVDLAQASYSPVELYTTISSGEWADVDAVDVDGETCFFSLDTSYNVVCNQYKEVDGEKKVVSTIVTVAEPVEDSETFGSFVFAEYGFIPEDGTQFEVEACGLHIKVVEVSEHRMENAIVTVLPEEEEEK